MDRDKAGKFGPDYSRKISLALRTDYEKSPSVCNQCGMSLPYKKRKNKFCNQSCSATARNTGRYTSPNREFTCVNCGAVGIDLKFSGVRVYCSPQCQAEHATRSNYEVWISGGSVTKSAVTLRGYLTRRDGYECSECGIDDWCGKPITLEVEHRDGNAENNSPDNLCLLCPNCHSQTDTYKGKNKGNGRHARRERYAEGLSY